VRTRAFALVLLLAAAFGGSSCLSPTLPLPPPEPSDIRPASTPGRWIIVGSSNQASAEIIVRVASDTTGPSTTSDASRRYSVEVDAKLCEVAILQELDPSSNEVSSVTFTIQPTQNGFPDSSCNGK
jgi:hypothetical protein